jgi:tetratricopeptide (TPR) repeat protein
MPRTRTRFFMVFTAMCVALPFALGSLACAHGPDPKEIKEAEAMRNAGRALVAEGRFRDALRDLLESEKINPKDSETQFLLGTTYFLGFKRHVEAEKHLAQAIELRTEEPYPEAQNMLGVVLIDAGRPAEAVPHLEKAKSNLLYTTPFFAEENLGIAKMKMGKTDEAIHHFKVALASQPDLCGAYYELADAYERVGKAELGMKTLQQFVSHCDTERLRPHCPPSLTAGVYYRLGMGHLKEENRNAAASAFQVCLERFPDEPVAKRCDESLKLLN